ncbi:succinylglutamate desuccinylase [Pseudogulbenkiania sp. MAI-1]|uniref:succinylglutamate desuccinylase n=1 Tax=Pseudogulbenkiania sp. MAI-1 TaxID=990370 RepID=UPI00045E73C2|nr:succinylglutamate desuccinylase [Pseudogulbenkiania sp. MAI-1]
MNLPSPSYDFLTSTLQNLPPETPEWSLANGATARWHERGILELIPSQLNDATDRVLVSCGVHGNETAPIEVANGILLDIQQGHLPLAAHVLLMFGNPEAMQAGERYLDYDMNRLFNGQHAKHPATREAQRAALLEQEAAAFFERAPAGCRRLHYDLHTAIRGSVFERFAIYPYLHERDYNREQLCWLESADITTVLLHSQPAATFTYYTSRHHQADSLTLELGKARPFGENDLSRFAGIDQALRRLLSGRREPLPPFANERFQLFRAKYDLVKHSDAFRLHLHDQVENFTLLEDGFVIAEDQDVRYQAQGGNERILFPNPKVGNGLRAGIVIEPVTI